MTIKVGIVGMVQTEAIIVSDRARKMMGNLDDLEINMKESGLIAPLAVKDNQDGTYTLLAGERRYTVLKRNNVDVIPARIYDQDLTDLEMKVIEKSENFYRKDFEYWELDKLTSEITDMQQAIHGKKAPGPGGTGWGLEDTGAMIGGVTKAAVSYAIRRAQAREVMPELFDNCKTASDANKVLKKIDEAVVKQAIAQKLESSKAESSIKQLSNRFIISDFFTGVKQIPNNMMHLVEIDPPYAIDLTEVKKSGVDTNADYNEIPADSYQVFLANLFAECYRIMADHSWLICWFAPEPWFEIIFQELSNACFETTRMCGIWTKPSGQTRSPDTKLANSYEMFFYAWKGRPALAKPGRSNIFDYAPVPPTKKTHPTERPVELIKEIYETFAFPGSRICIPFLGSGSGIFAAEQAGMSAVGFELSQAYKDSFLVKASAMK